MSNLYLSLYDISALMDTLKNVKRTIFLPNSEQYEDVAQHTADLIMFSWYAATKTNCVLDISKVIKLAAVHDIHETLAGDIDAYHKENKILAEYKIREHEAINTLSDQFKDFPELVEAMKEFQTQQTIEARFVSCCDKLLPCFLEIQNRMKTVIHKQIDLETLKSKLDTFDEFPEFVELYEVILKEFEALLLLNVNKTV